MERLGGDDFNHEQFKKTLARVANTEIIYKGISWYLQYQPLLLNDLLAAVSARLDHSRVMKLLSSDLPLIKPYLIANQKKNLRPINEALNSVFIEEENFEALRESISAYPEFDSTALAKQLAPHDSLEARRVSALLYRQLKKWDDSLALSKQDRLWDDALVTAFTSQSPEVAQDIAQYFLDVGANECFSAALYVCYDLLQRDWVEQVAWLRGSFDLITPYRLQSIATTAQRVSVLFFPS